MSNKAAARSYYMMLMGGAVSLPTTPGGGECDPYSKPLPNAANVDLTTLLTRLPTNAANVNLLRK